MNHLYDAQSSTSSEIKPGCSTVEKLKSLIASEDLAPGSRLPSERDLIDRFKITRANLRKAFDICFVMWQLALIILKIFDEGNKNAQRGMGC